MCTTWSPAWPTLGFSQPSRITCRCKDGKLTLPRVRSSSSTRRSICTTWSVEYSANKSVGLQSDCHVHCACLPVIQSFPMDNGFAASRMASFSFSHLSWLRSSSKSFCSLLTTCCRASLVVLQLCQFWCKPDSTPQTRICYPRES